MTQKYERELRSVFEGGLKEIAFQLRDFPKKAPIAIVGSTKIATNRARYLIRASIVVLNPSVIVSGGAEGIDSLAAETAKAYGIELDERLPDVHQWHGITNEGDQYRRGFMDRNREIADRCHGLIRIPCIQSTTYGSGWTRDRAREQKKPTAEFWLRDLD